jgi:hypothetical protein
MRSHDFLRGDGGIGCGEGDGGGVSLPGTNIRIEEQIGVSVE